MMLKRMFKHKAVKVIAILMFLGFMVLSQHACVDSLDSNDGSENPVNTFLLNMTANPNTLFGNASEESFLIGINEAATVNISATITLADGRRESDFTTVVLDGVGIVQPTPGPVVIVPHPSTTPAPTNIAVPLAFQTVGIEPGTLVEISLSNPDIGSLNGGGDPQVGDAIYVAPILGNVNAGQFFVQYNAFVGQGGTQIILARTQLQIPPEFAALCPLISEEDGLIEVVVIITQEVAEPPAPPTPGP